MYSSLVDFFSETGILGQTIGDIFFVNECLSNSSTFETGIIFNPLINFLGISVKSFSFFAGIKRVIYGNEESVFTNVHKNPTNTEDIKELEKQIVALNHEEYEEYINSQNK